MLLLESGIFNAIGTPQTGTAIKVHKYDSFTVAISQFSTGNLSIQTKDYFGNWLNIYSATYGGNSGILQQFNGPHKELRLAVSTPFSGALSATLFASNNAGHI